MGETPKFMMIAGVVIFLLGLLFFLAEKSGVSGRLPGDIFIRKDNVSFYFPVVTCIVLSIVLTVLFNLFGKK